MSFEIKKFSRLRKSTLLKDVPIWLEVIDHKSIYDRSFANTRLYTHDMIELSMVLAGNGIHRILDQEIPCKKGDVYMVRQDIPHGYFVTEAEDTLTVRRILFDVNDWFTEDAADENGLHYCHGVFQDNAITAYAMLNEQTEGSVEFYCRSIAEELERKEDEWRCAIASHLSLLLITIARYINGAIKNIPSAPLKEWSIVSSVMRMVLETFYDSELTLESIAAEMFLSPSYISRLFKQLTGRSFSGYIRTVRLENASRLLRDTNLNIPAVVEACGLRDLPSFYAAFQKHTDMTPSQYRNWQTNLQNNKSKEELKGERHMIILSEISAQLQAGKAKIVKEMVQQAIDEGIAPEEILTEGLISGMNVVGEKFKNNEVFVPEVLVAARAMNQGVSLLKPLLMNAGVEPAGKVCIGTVRGDLHDIGKNLVKMMLEGKGFEVVDLGTDVTPEAFVNAAIEQNCDIICCSALLTTTMGVMEEVVKAAEAAGIRDKVKIMIGGAPVTEAYCEKIGADAYTVDAASAADKALALVK